MPQEIKITKTHYIKDNIKFDRVTSVLDYFSAPELVEWRIKNVKSKEISKTAKAIGTRIHTIIEQFHKIERLAFTPHDSQAVINCGRAYQRWYQIEQPKIILMEQTVFDNELGIAGTFDMATEDCLWDYKTSEQIRANYWLQLAIYNYMTKEKYRYIGILRLDKLTADYEAVKIEYDKRLANCFKGLLNYYRYLTNYNLKEEYNGKDDSANAKISTRFSIFEPENSGDWAFRNRQE